MRQNANAFRWLLIPLELCGGDGVSLYWRLDDGPFGVRLLYGGGLGKLSGAGPRRHHRTIRAVRDGQPKRQGGDDTPASRDRPRTPAARGSHRARPTPPHTVAKDVPGPACRGPDQACRTRLVTESRNSAARDRDLPSSGISAQPTA
jgi:hypothetical protein